MDLSAARRLFPLATEEGLRSLRRVREHPCAPRWTHQIGDHLVAADLEAVDAFRSEVEAHRSGARRGPPPALVERLAALRERVPLWQQRIGAGFAMERDWAYLPTTRREDLASRIDLAVPLDEPLDRLIVYETSGTTGHALRIPHHPRAVAQLHVLVERALGWYGLPVRQGPEVVACMNLRAQASVWIYASIFSVWRQAGFARLNLNPHAWAGGVEHARRFIAELTPGFLSGDPASFAELLRLEVACRPAALFSSAVELTDELKRLLEARCGCPVIDWYSTTETGPVACSLPGACGLAMVAPDLYVELVDDDGLPVPEGERGEITVSGGRNPFLPLLRYRTGDYARMTYAGDEPLLVGFEGRASVVFRAADHSPVSPVDVGRALRQSFAVVQHEFVQRADGSCLATLRPAYGVPVDPAQVEAELRALFGALVEVKVHIDPTLGCERKVVPFRCELEAPARGPR
jgi:phenylacetate-CoA ligase